MLPEVKPAQRWKHYKGTIYRVVCVAFREDDRALIVIYTRESGDGVYWARPLSEWHDYVERGVRRFTPMEEGKP